MRPFRVRRLAEHPDFMLLRLVAGGPTPPRPGVNVARILASRQAVTLEGLIAKSEHALADWRRTPPEHRSERSDEAICTCLEQALATLQALPVAPVIQHLGVPFGMRAAALARKEASQ